MSCALLLTAAGTAALGYAPTLASAVVLGAAFAAVCVLAAAVALASTTLRRVGLGTPRGV
ncbi:hypothetical protein [Streptomyces sp. NPDC008139]|uniref:hypothetical protein n=1 Tax=Streptomyces sp. NPDC008139 TaxID=3364814 RepID=UPI0036F068AC